MENVQIQNAISIYRSFATTMDDEREEEQKMEIEALRSIFMDDFRDVPFDSGDRIGVVDRDENIACYEIVVSPLGIGEDASDAANTLSRPRPRERAIRRGLRAHERVPERNATTQMPVGEKYKREGCLAVTEMVRSKARRELLGAPMMYDVVEHAKEWLRRRTRITTEHDDDDDLLGEDAEEKAKKRLELEAEERLKAMRETGTPVTKETFEEWARRSTPRERWRPPRRCQKKLWAKEARHVRKRNKGSFPCPDGDSSRKDTRRFTRKRTTTTTTVEKTPKTLPKTTTLFPKVWKTRRKTRMSRAISSDNTVEKEREKRDVL